MRDGPFADLDAFRAHLESFCAVDKVVAFAIIDRRTNAVGGMISLMRHDPVHRTIELGYALILPALQRTFGATEALFLTMRLAMETMNCRRCEWRCDSENVASHRAALRLRFKLEGRLRQHLLVKGRNRDTLVLSLLDTEWPDRKAAIEDWLRPENFDAAGQQIIPLRR
jgi:RimJ/RimL family protein N-acetyltransferase